MQKSHARISDFSKYRKRNIEAKIIRGLTFLSFLTIRGIAHFRIRSFFVKIDF